MTNKTLFKSDFQHGISFRFPAAAVLLAAALSLMTACGNKGSAASSAAAASAATETTVSASASAAETTAPQETSVSADAASAAAASSAAETTADPMHPFHDADFPAHVATGLVNRWKLLASTDTSKMNADDFKEFASDLAQAELDAVGDLNLYGFSAQGLSGYAEAYIEALELQQQGIRELKSADELGSNKNYMYGYYSRVLVLHELTENYGLKVPAEYQADLDETLTEYENAKKYLGVQ